MTHHNFAQRQLQIITTSNQRRLQTEQLQINADVKQNNELHLHKTRHVMARGYVMAHERRK